MLSVLTVWRTTNCFSDPSTRGNHHDRETHQVWLELIRPEPRTREGRKTAPRRIDRVRRCPAPRPPWLHRTLGSTRGDRRGCAHGEGQQLGDQRVLLPASTAVT